jgi:hypothetical protein
MPGRGWYVLAAAILVGSIAGAVWFGAGRVANIDSSLIQVVVPGGADLDLKVRGTYTIFHERRSQVGGTLYNVEDVSGLRVRIRAAASGRDIALRRPAAQSTYSFGGRSGVSMLAFDVEAPGMYRLDAAYDDGRRQPQTVLAVSTGFLGGLFATIAIAGGITLAGVGVAVTIFIVVLLRRRRAMQAAAWR